MTNQPDTSSPSTSSDAKVPKKKRGANQRCAVCYWPEEYHEAARCDVASEAQGHEYVAKYDTDGADELFCPWCGEENDATDVENGWQIECDDCGRSFSVEIDYTPVYATARLTCFACKKATPQPVHTKLGADRSACSDDCAAKCNEAYEAYRADETRSLGFPRRGFAVIDVSEGTR